MSGEPCVNGLGLMGREVSQMMWISRFLGATAVEIALGLVGVLALFLGLLAGDLEAPWRRLESTVGRRHGRSGHQTMPRDRIEAGQSARCPARAI
jgi:hypothetical protein